MRWGIVIKKMDLVPTFEAPCTYAKLSKFYFYVQRLGSVYLLGVRSLRYPTVSIFFGSGYRLEGSRVAIHRTLRHTLCSTLWPKCVLLGKKIQMQLTRRSIFRMQQFSPEKLLAIVCILSFQMSNLSVFKRTVGTYSWLLVDTRQAIQCFWITVQLLWILCAWQ